MMPHFFLLYSSMLNFLRCSQWTIQSEYFFFSSKSKINWGKVMWFKHEPESIIFYFSNSLGTSFNAPKLQWQVFSIIRFLLLSLPIAICLFLSWVIWKRKQKINTICAFDCSKLKLSKIEGGEDGRECSLSILLLHAN